MKVYYSHTLQSAVCSEILFGGKWEVVIKSYTKTNQIIRNINTVEVYTRVIILTSGHGVIPV